MSISIQSPVTKTYRPNADASLTLADESALSKTVVRAGESTDAAAHLAQPFGASREADGVLIAGTRPDEWMLIGGADDVETALGALPRPGHVSVIDWTHSRAQFRLTGDLAASALEKVCGLDWSDSMTPDGAVTSGSVAKVTCDLVRNDVDGVRSYLVLCDRSFGQYMFDALLDSGDEFGISANT